MVKSKKRQRRKRFAKLERKAYHEAGHALIACINRVPFQSVTVVGPFLGEVWFESWLNHGAQEMTERRIANWVMAAYGGVTAELVVTGRFYWKSAEEDKSLARSLVLTVTTSEKEALAFQKLMFIRARALLETKHNRMLLDTLAKELLAQKTLSRRRVGRIIRTAVDLPTFSRG